ncbi:glycosyltransferase [Microbacterium sp. NC79]|nr:glycosyltransferase [Microbacterium sp. NC79]MBV0894066.1 glycosyltransferase [Microbacterium sp. NC79]
MPLFNDEKTLASSLQSAVSQTLRDIEIICVDDASTDGTVRVIEEFVARDSRVRLVRHKRNGSAWQARRTGIHAANADYVLFLDGDDELAPDAALRTRAEAQATDADLVGFGVTVLDKDGRRGGSYEGRLQPRHRRLDGEAVLAGLFPIDMPAQGQLWRYLFRTTVLRDAYARLPQDLVLPRVNDLPLMFLVAAVADRYVSIDDKLYRYHFGRGGSGQNVDSIERAEFYASAIRSIDIARPAVEKLAESPRASSQLRAAYESARLSLVGYVGSQLLEKSESAVIASALQHLHTLVSATDLIRGMAKFYPGSLPKLKAHTPWQPLVGEPVRSIMLATSSLRTGGVTAVIASQARYLREAGYRVTVVARSQGTDRAAIPDSVTFRELTKNDLMGKLSEWAEICREQQIDVVIDHQVLYTQYWPEFALIAKAEGAATIGWLHNFVGRPIYDGTQQLTRIEEHSNTLAQLVVLSPLDVAYFKLRGVDHVAYVPNPPSSLLLNAVSVAKIPPTGTLNLVWWGRLEERTKQVSELIAVGTHLRDLGVDFQLNVIGPDWEDFTAKKFNALARGAGVGSRVRALGPRHGASLLREIDKAHAFVSTSIIEGYQLTIAEAQARGLPVFMYELPWLTLVQNNDGVIAVRQGDAGMLASKISNLLSNAAYYDALSRASLDAAQRATDYDFAALYVSVVTGCLPAHFSPQPTLDDARRLLELTVFFAERSKCGRRPRGARRVTTRFWSRVVPIGREVVRRIPALGPFAYRVKGWLKGR